jgi:hypothetical protein
MVASLQVQVQNPKTYLIHDPLTHVQQNVTIVNGKSVYFSVVHNCKFTTEICRRTANQISGDYYLVPYTPSRPSSTIEDFYSERTDLLTYLQKRFQYKSYLEIGCSENVNFNPMKQFFNLSIGVDPYSGGTHTMRSDEFFQQNEQKFDLIFIDGDHHAEQVWKDIVNALACLSEGGTVVLHDLNPMLKETQEEVQTIIWNGDAWRAAVAMRLVSDYEIIVVDIDHGCGVIRKRPNVHLLPENWHQALLQLGTLPGQTLPGAHSLSYEDFDIHREILFRLMSLVEMREWLEIQ